MCLEDKDQTKDEMNIVSISWWKGKESDQLDQLDQLLFLFSFFLLHGLLLCVEAFS